MFHLFLFPNKRSFRGPGGVGRGLDLRCQAKTCAEQMAFVASRAPVASRGLPLHTVSFIPETSVALGVLAVLAER